MKLLKIIILFFIIQWQLVAPFDFRESSDQFSEMLRKLAGILGKCAFSKLGRTGIIRHSKYQENFPQEFFNNISVINLKDSNAEEFALARKRTPGNQDGKLNVFIVVTSSISNFRNLIEKMRKSAWWNPLGWYLILDEHTPTTGCMNALHFLLASWYEDLLYVTYVCLDPRNGYTMYTFNPYTRNMPPFWEEAASVYITVKNHPWFLFKQRLLHEKDMCKRFSLREVRSIDGYGIRAVAITADSKLSFDPNKAVYERLKGYDGELLNILFRKLNVSLNVTVIEDKHADVYELFPRIQAGEYDMLLNSQFTFNKPHLTKTYPHDDGGLGILTQYPDYQHQHERILDYMNRILVSLIFLVYLLCSTILWLCTRRGFTYSMLEGLRLLFATSLFRAPRRTSLRIFIISVTILLMLTDSAFRSSLSTLLTVRIQRAHIENLSDLKASNLKIYTYHRYNSVVFQEWMQPRLILTNQRNCADIVERDKNAACITDKSKLLKAAYEKGLHHGRKRVLSIFYTFIVRPNWPLRARFDLLVMHLNQGGHVSTIRKKYIKRVKEKLAIFEKNQKMAQEYHVMQLNDLSFAFFILLLGHGISFIVFLIELLTFRRHSLRVTFRGC